MVWRSQITDSADKDILRKADRIRRDAQRVERKIAKATKLERARLALQTAETKFRQPRQRDAAYLSWLRRAPCLFCEIRGTVQIGRTEAAHVRRSYPEPGWRPVGAAEKPSDFRCLPQCPACHAWQHQHDNHGFYAELGIYPPSVCAELKSEQEAGADPVETIQNIAAEIRGQK